MEIMRTPADSSQRKIFSVSSAEAEGAGPGEGLTVSALATRASIYGARNQGGPSQPTEAGTDDLPAAQGVRSSRHDLGAVGKRLDALGPGGGLNQVEKPVANCPGILVTLLTREHAHPLAKGSDDRPRVTRDHRYRLFDDDRVVLDALVACTRASTTAHLRRAQSSDRPVAERRLVH